MIDDSFWQQRAGRAGAYATGYEGFDPRFAEALASLVQDWERQTGQQADFTSFGRTPEQGREIWERSGHGKRFLAAAPGKSRHEYDLAAGRYATAADIPRGDFLDYAHQNAGKYGLEFLSGNAFARDPVHIQLSRGGPGGGPSGSPGPSFDASSDPFDISILRALGGGSLTQGTQQRQSDDTPFDVSILRALGGGPLVDVNLGGESFGGAGGSDSQIGAAYSDSLGDDAQTAASTLSSVGWAPDEIAAAIGNASAESTHDAGAINQSSGAAGLWQWLGDRKQGLLNFAAQLGKVWTDPEVQALWLNAERTGASVQYGGSNEAANFARAFASEGVVPKVAAFAQSVERAADSDIAQSMSRRVNGALAFLSGGGDAASRWGDEWTQMSYTPPTGGYAPGAGMSSPFVKNQPGAGLSAPFYSPGGAPVSPPTPRSRSTASPPASPPTPTPRPATAEPEMPFWNEPDYNELQGGSKHAYHFNRDTGRGVYRTSSGKLIAYDAESGMSSPIGERNIDQFVNTSPPREGGGRRRIDGGSTLGDASRDPVARALSDAVRPWPKAEPSPIRILAKLGVTSGGPPASATRDPVQAVQILAQIKKGGNILDYTYAIKNYADLLDTTPEALNEAVKQAEFAGWEPGPPLPGGGAPTVKPEDVIAKLATMSEGDPAYYTTLHAGAAASGMPEADLKSAVEARRKGAGAVPDPIDLTIEVAGDTKAAQAYVAIVTEPLHSIPKTHPSYKIKRAQVLNDLAEVLGPERAAAELNRLGF